MKKLLLPMTTVLFSTIVYGQVGINTPKPQGSLHVDGAKNNPTTGAPNLAQQQDDFTVMPSGNVGIGTTAPREKLDVGGNSIFSATDSPVKVTLENTGGSNLSNGAELGRIVFNGKIAGANRPLAGIKANYWGNGFSNLSSLTLSTSDRPAVLINESGDVGIGRVDTNFAISPTQKLDVDGNVRFRNVPNSNSITSTERIMLLEADGTAKKVPIETIQQSLSKMYYKYYVFTKNNGDDWISNFDTKIPENKYTALITGFDTNLIGPGAGFKNNDGSTFDFQIANIIAFTEGGTWRLKIDVPNAKNNTTSMAWGIKLLIISNEQITNLEQSTFDLGSQNTSSALVSPVP
ncbi:hypothetical protein [Chryseobacterium sp. R2ACT005]|uniref:hypothetical protein n=1 Tax=Chryseobacterium sp. R2ACT005 TaxID=3416668 RepID=UPI003CF6DEB9